MTEAPRIAVQEPLEKPSFGQLLKELRSRHHFTQEVLGDILRVSRHTVSRLERNISDPPKKPGFYEHFREIPNVALKEEIGSIIRTASAFLWAKYPPRLVNTEHSTTSSRKQGSL